MVVIVPVGVVIDDVVIVRPAAAAAAKEEGTVGRDVDVDVDVDEAEAETPGRSVFLISLVFPSLGEFAGLL